ncbi:MAG: type III secretion protein [Candidatus Accumulibacter sp.]|jgi:type III secretion protein O|nr:type III secretion protein [Accumulibacter sp.]
MPYPLAGLLRIRDFRVDAASKAMRAAETRVRAAQAELAEKEAEWERYGVWRQEEVERRYQSIMNRAMLLPEIDAFKAGLSALADQELLREEAARKAARALEKAREEARNAREGWLLANRERQKIDYHRDNWQQYQAKEESRREDVEQEEFKPLLFETGSDEPSYSDF